MPSDASCPSISGTPPSPTEEARAAAIGRVRLGHDLAHPFRGHPHRERPRRTDLTAACESLLSALGSAPVVQSPHRRAIVVHAHAVRLVSPLSGCTCWHSATLRRCAATVSSAGRPTFAVGPARMSAAAPGHRSGGRLVRSFRCPEPSVSRRAIDPGVARGHRRLPAQRSPTVSRRPPAVHSRRSSWRPAVPAPRQARNKALSWALERVRPGVDLAEGDQLRGRLSSRAGPAGAGDPGAGDDGRGASGTRSRLPRARLLLEYQGDEHRVSRQRWLEDLTRVQLFEDAGYRVIAVGARRPRAGLPRSGAPHPPRLSPAEHSMHCAKLQLRTFPGAWKVRN